MNLSAEEHAQEGTLLDKARRLEPVEPVGAFCGWAGREARPAVHRDLASIQPTQATRSEVACGRAVRGDHGSQLPVEMSRASEAVAAAGCDPGALGGARQQPGQQA